jgi:hypothetical protein
VAWLPILLMAVLIVVSLLSRPVDPADKKVCWLVEHSAALRFFVLFIGVMSCFYAIVSQSLSVQGADSLPQSGIS